MKSKLNYRMIGEGHPVVFLHGFLESMTMWEYLNLESFPFQKIIVDLPGHGKSALTDEIPSIVSMASEVLKLLHELGIESYSVVGHSMGGYVALELNKIYPADHIVLFCSNFWEDSTEKKKDRVRVADIVFKAKNKFIQEAIPGLFGTQSLFLEEKQSLISEAKQMSSEAVAYASLAMRTRKDFTDEVKRGRVHPWVIQGENDSVVTKSVMLELLEQKKDRYIEIPNVGHMAHIEAPNLVEKALEQIFSK